MKRALVTALSEDMLPFEDTSSLTRADHSVTDFETCADSSDVAAKALRAVCCASFLSEAISEAVNGPDSAEKVGFLGREAFAGEFQSVDGRMDDHFWKRAPRNTGRQLVIRLAHTHLRANQDETFPLGSSG